jgi:hypothetical protein
MTMTERYPISTEVTAQSPEEELRLAALAQIATSLTPEEREAAELGLTADTPTDLSDALKDHSYRVLEKLSRHAVQDLLHQPSYRK